MAKQLVTDIVINLAGNLATKSRQYSQSMSQFAANNQRAMNMLRMSTAAAGRGIDAMGSRYMALGAAVVGAQRSKAMPNWTAGSPASPSLPTSAGTRPRS